MAREAVSQVHFRVRRTKHAASCQRLASHCVRSTIRYSSASFSPVPSGRRAGVSRTSAQAPAGAPAAAAMPLRSPKSEGKPPRPPKTPGPVEEPEDLYVTVEGALELLPATGRDSCDAFVTIRADPLEKRNGRRTVVKHSTRDPVRHAPAAAGRARGRDRAAPRAAAWKLQMLLAAASAALVRGRIGRRFVAAGPACGRARARCARSRRAGCAHRTPSARNAQDKRRAIGASQCAAQPRLTPRAAAASNGRSPS